jgi:redox-sensitive bicupin YhaK (pirin superfamily)
MGHEAVLKANDIQAMTAGSGITHSESNKSDSNLTHLLQIWLFPEQKGLRPSYHDKTIDPNEKKDRWRLIVSPDGREDSLVINQDASVYASILDRGKSLEHRLESGRHGWLQVARGEVTLNGTALERGDGASISEEREIRVEATEEAEMLLFDLK